MADKKPFAGVAQDESIGFLKQIIGLLRPLGVITGNGNPRLSVDVNSVTGTIANVTTVATVTATTSVGTVGNQTNMGGVNAFELMKAMNTAAYNTGVRANIT